MLDVTSTLSCFILMFNEDILNCLMVVMPEGSSDFQMYCLSYLVRVMDRFLEMFENKMH